MFKIPVPGLSLQQGKQAPCTDIDMYDIFHARHFKSKK